MSGPATAAEESLHFETTSLFLFIGADANTTWLRGCVELDRHGFVLTGTELPPGTAESERWRAAGRAPFLLETSLPGVFAAGDVRSGSVKRVRVRRGRRLDGGELRPRPHRAAGLGGSRCSGGSRSRSLLCLAGARAEAQQRPCDRPAPLGPSRDLYCIELVPAPGITGASGTVELGHVTGPFTVAVTPEGFPRHHLILSAAGLPSPAALGAFRTYVAWAAPPSMHPMRRLGTVARGP